MRALLLSTIVLSAFAASAVEPETWKVTSTDDFLGGEIDGLAISATDELLPGPSIEKLAEVSDPFVFSQASAGDGSIYLGTGNEGKVYRLRGGNLELVFDSDEQQINALAISGNDLFAGSSPYGKVYRIDLRTGASEVWAEVGEAYIWDIEPIPGSGLAVATGLEGKLYRVAKKGEVSVLFDAPEMHLRSIVSRPDGTILTGGSGEGRIYEIAPGGEVRALYDSSLTEISALYLDPATGLAWAAGGKSVLPTTAPQQQQQQQQQQQKSESDQQDGGQSGQSSEGEGSVSVSFSFDSGSTPIVTQPIGSSELYRIDSEGQVETVWRLDREIIYSIDRAADGNGVVVSTGANGRVYRVEKDRIALVAELPEKQVVSYRADGSRAIVTTTNSGAVFELDFSSHGPVSFQSVVKDTKRLSRFGEYMIEGRDLPRKITASWRSGNTSTPDETWSDWRKSSGASGSIGAPPARYLQWKIEMNDPSAGMAIEDVTATFINRNVAPKVDSFGVADPAVVFLTGGYPSPPGIVEATNPDQYGIFTSVDQPSQQESVKKYFRKGYRTVSWKTSDPNGDELRHDLHFRRRGMNDWLRLRENVRGDQMNFDTTQLPDGEYELKLTVSDEPSNPVDGKSTERSDLFFTVDNTAPVIRAKSSNGGASVTIVDAASPVTKVEYAVDAEEWKTLLPEDGISDSKSETYRIDGSEISGRYVIIRAVDAYYNVATAGLEQ